MKTVLLPRLFNSFRLQLEDPPAIASLVDCPPFRVPFARDPLGRYYVVCTSSGRKAIHTTPQGHTGCTFSYEAHILLMPWEMPTKVNI